RTVDRTRGWVAVERRRSEVVWSGVRVVTPRALSYAIAWRCRASGPFAARCTRPERNRSARWCLLCSSRAAPDPSSPPETPMETLADNPGIIVVPPLLYLVAFLVVLALRWFLPLRISDNAVVPWLGLLLIVPGVATVFWGRRTLQAMGTNVNPRR